MTEKENFTEAGAAIKDEEDRQIFFDDFNSGDWYGLK